MNDGVEVSTQAPVRKKNSMWRRGALRHRTGMQIEHPTRKESYSYDDYVQKFAREEPGWHKGARVAKR